MRGAGRAPKSWIDAKRCRVVEAILGDADVAEVAPRCALGVLGTHALGAKPLDFELQVGADLVLEVALRAAADHQAFSGVGPGSMHAGDGIDEPVPAPRLDGELFAARSR